MSRKVTPEEARANMVASGLFTPDEIEFTMNGHALDVMMWMMGDGPGPEPKPAPPAGGER